MTLRVRSHGNETEPSADWDVETELQKELDAVSICSHVSSSSSATGTEENLPADDADRTSNSLHKLLEDWRIKERKLNTFETMLSGTRQSTYGILGRINDQGQKPSFEPEDINEVHCLIDPLFQIGDSDLKETKVSQIDSMTVGEPSTDSSSLSQQGPGDLPPISPGISSTHFENSEQVWKLTDSSRPLQDPETSSKRVISDNITKSQQKENDFPCCAMDYEDALSMIRKKRMAMLEEYRAAEAERLVGKNLKRQRETEESRRILLSASQRRQELEIEILKGTQQKIALLDLEVAKRFELSEELQRSEERDSTMQILECRSRSLFESVDTNKGQDDELELRRLEEDKTLAVTSDQEETHECAVQSAPDEQCVKFCVRIQSWIRGFICRRNYQILKYQNSQALVSLLLPIYATSEIQACCGPEYPPRSGLSEGPIDVQEYLQRGVQKECGSIAALQDRTYVRSQSPEEILTMLTGLARSGSMQEFKSCLALAISYGLNDEASAVEAELIQRKENVLSWLEQVVLGWETTKSKIQIEIEEARRLELFPITTVAEAVTSAREKEIHKNLESSILKASRRNYSYWMRKAKNFGLEDTLKIFSKSFQRKLKTVTNSLKREAKLGTKEKYGVLFKNAISLGLQLDVDLALKVVLKRVLQVLKRTILMECTSLADINFNEQDWNRLEMEGAEIGLDSGILAEIRRTLGMGRSLESVQRVWVNTFKANDAGVPCTVCPGTESSFEGGDLKIDVSGTQLPGNSSQFPIPSTIFVSSVSVAAVMPGWTAPLSLPQNWAEMNCLQRDWQRHALNLRNIGKNSSNSHQGGYSEREHNSLPTRFTRDKICDSTANPTATKNLWESADFQHRPVSRLEGTTELSGNEGDLIGVSQPHLSEMLEFQKVTSKKFILTRELVEKKAGCPGTQLSWAIKLDLNDQQLKSLGRGHIFRWCPRLRFLRVDMNKLTTLRGVFLGGEDTLEQVSVKDNLLRDMAGLECLGNVSVLHLDGNLLSHLGFPSSYPISSKGNGKKGGNIYISAKNTNHSSQPNPLLKYPVVECCWPKLKVLTVGRNRLTKVLQLGNLCPNLEILDVGSNQIFSLGGTDDNSLAGLQHLRVLDVGQNRLQGRSLWKGLENCPELASLVASRNKLRELPTHVGSVLLREIWLNGNAIKRLSCKAWLPSLQRLYLQDNMIDSLESLWGSPALEVLDLSFNSISELSQLRHLSCFPCLRSLQLNDNPVSEQEDHTSWVLQAVPWLAELDNEAVAKVSRGKAVKMIFKRIMDAIGLEFVKEKLARGEVLLRGFSNPSAPHRCAFNGVEGSDSNTSQLVYQGEVNNVLNGEADEWFLWEVLSEAKSLSSSSSIIKNLVNVNADMVKFEGLRNILKSELEAKFNMSAYRQMTIGLKGRLHAATKETCIARTLKEGDHSVPFDTDRDHLNENSCRVAPSLMVASESRRSSDKAKDCNLQQCLEEHTTFDSTRGREVYIENKEYTFEEQTQTRRVRKLQALTRHYLTRIRTRLLRKQKTAMRLEQEHKCAGKIQTFWRAWKVRQAYLLDILQGKRFSASVIVQAHWRGYSTRLRFRRALDMARYMDDDDFEYVPFDDCQFLARETALSSVYQPIEGMFSALSEPSACSTKTMAENNDIFVAKDGKGMKSAGWKTDDSHETSQLSCTYECHTDDAVRLASEGEIDGSQGLEVSQEPLPADALSLEESKRLSSVQDEICGTQKGLQAESTGPEMLEVLEKKEKHMEEEKDITELLERIGIKPDLNMPVDESITEEDVNRIFKGHEERFSLSLGDHKNDVVPDASTVPAAEVKKRATIEELAKDWGLKDVKTAQSLLKARQRSEKRVKDDVHRNILQDPAQRLKRFKEKVQGQVPALAAPSRHFEKRPPLNFSGPALQMPVDEQESHALPKPELLQKSETDEHKTDGCSGPPPVPRFPSQQKKKSCCTGSVENKTMRKHPTKNARKLSPIHLSTVVLTTALPAPLYNL